ncbi:MAG: hypothetical protein J0L75_21490, partial [Spirochaetes bacterium]|nr:hypothetical protein [Spirochaetota bacterium]
MALLLLLFAAFLFPQKGTFTLGLAIPPNAPQPAPAALKIPRGAVQPVSAMALFGSNRLLAVGGYREVAVWDPSTGRLLTRLLHPDLGGPVTSLLWISNRGLLAAGSGVPGRKGSVVFFREDGTPVEKAWKDGLDSLVALQVNSNGNLLAMGGMDRRAYLLDLASGALAAPSLPHEAAVLSAAWGSNDARLATGDALGNILLWDTADWELLGSAKLAGPILGLAFDLRGPTLLAAVGGWVRRGLVVLTPQLSAASTNTGDSNQKPKYDLRTTRELPIASGTPVSMTAMAKPAFRILLPCSDGAIRHWDGNNFSTLAQAPRDFVLHAAILAGDPSMLLLGLGDGTVRLFDVGGGLRATFLQTHPGASQYLAATAYGPLLASQPSSLTWWSKTNVLTHSAQLTESYLRPESVRTILTKKPLPPAPPSTNRAPGAGATNAPASGANRGAPPPPPASTNRAASAPAGALAAP